MSVEIAKDKACYLCKGPKPSVFGNAGATFAEALLKGKKVRTASNSFGRNVLTLSSRSVGDLSHILLLLSKKRNPCKVEQSATGSHSQV